MGSSSGSVWSILGQLLEQNDGAPSLSAVLSEALQFAKGSHEWHVTVRVEHREET